MRSFRGTRQPPRLPPRRAFTLVELLAVIGIVTVLLAILLPAVGAARFEARGLQCRNNVRQLTLGLLSYAVEYKGKFPPNVLSPAPGQFWFDDMRVGNHIPCPPPGAPPETSVYVCPEDDAGRRSYSMNAWASSKLDPSYYTPPLQGERWGTSVKLAPRLVLLAETWSYTGSPSTGYSSQPTVGAWGVPGRRFGGGGGLPAFNAGRWRVVNCELAYARHRRRNGPGVHTQPRGRVVMAFGDGHVELLASDELVNFQTGELTNLAFWSPLEAKK